MIQTVIIAAPALVALVVCILRGPKRAFLDVYLPTLLLLPQSFNWPISGQLPFADAAMVPIALPLLIRPQRPWRWSSLDLLVVVYLVITVISEGTNNGYKLGQNLALQQFCRIFMLHFSVKQLIQERQFAIDFAKRIVVLISIAAIISVYEFRMGSDLFLLPFLGFFPGTQIPTVFRAGFMRVQGPYGHAITAGFVMVFGFRIARWLDWSALWTERMRFLPIGRVRFCELAIITGSFMTLSVGPWVAAAGGALIVSIFRASNRKRAVVVLLFITLIVGPSVYSAFEAYVSVDRSVAETGLQEDSAYRNELMPLYVPIVEQRPALGWGRNTWPVLNGMTSIDNAFLLMALTFGLYALGVFVVILLWPPIWLCRLGLRLPSDHPAALAAYTLTAIFILTIIVLGTGCLGDENARFLFLITGWSAGLLEMAPVELEAPQTRKTSPRQGRPFSFAKSRVMA